MIDITHTPQTQRLSQRLRDKFKDLTFIKSEQTRFGKKFHVFFHNRMNMLYVVKVENVYGADSLTGNLVKIDFTPHGGKCYLSANELKLVKGIFLGSHEEDVKE